MGIRVSIYRAEHHSALNVFNNVRELTIVNAEGPFEPSPEAPAAVLIQGHALGSVRVVPAKLVTRLYADARDVWLPDIERRPMFGGSYVGTSDGRFARKVQEICGYPTGGATAVALHDRIEQ